MVVKDLSSGALLEDSLVNCSRSFEWAADSKVFSSSLLLPSLELSDTKSMSLKYEPSSEPLHISVKLLSLGRSTLSSR